MKARKPQEIVRVPLVFGRAEGDMISWGGYEQQLDLFREVLDHHTKVLTLALREIHGIDTDGSRNVGAALTGGVNLRGAQPGCLDVLTMQVTRAGGTNSWRAAFGWRL